jgi:hypothetical protein
MTWPTPSGVTSCAPARPSRVGMKKRYVLTVALTVGAHFGYLLYLPSGGFLALRWPRSILLHVPAVGWGICVVACGSPCPLTRLEEWARARAEMNPLPVAGFTERYVAGVFYPSHATRIAQALAFAAAAVSWVMLAAKHRQSASRPSRLRS